MPNPTPIHTPDGIIPQAPPSSPHLTLRDQFAMAALNGLLANHLAWDTVMSQQPMHATAQTAYELADAMMAERGQ